MKIIKHKIQLYHEKLKYNAPIHDIIGILIDYNVIETKLNCGGYCDYTNKIIAVHSNCINNPTEFQQIIYHEIGHAIQAELGRFNIRNLNTLSANLQIEQQAETINYILYNAINTHNPLHHTKFDAYFKTDSIKFLSDWYGNYIQNDIEFKK